VNTCHYDVSIRHLPTSSNFLKPFLVLRNTLHILDGLGSAVVQDTMPKESVHPQGGNLRRRKIDTQKQNAWVFS
jgi:hypothetical protein